MNNHYLQHYQVLNVQPGCSFHDLQYAYRRLVKNWHPDHFTTSHENRDRVHAETKFKEINKAFRSLSEYYKKNGRLPLGPEDVAGQGAGGAPFWPDGSQASDRRPPQHKKVLATSVSLRFTIIGAILGIAYVAWNASQQDQEKILAIDSSTNPVQLEQPPLGSPKQPETQDHFTIGSTLGDVIATQGVPTSIEGEIWHYGLSKVYFEKGVVVKWDEYPINPLKAYLISVPRKAAANSFTLGSTKHEVRTAQGVPLQESKNMWEYRISRIYFKNDKVSGWYDSPLDPLKIQR